MCLEYMNWEGARGTPLPHSAPSSVFARVSLFWIKVIKAEIWKPMFSEKVVPLLLINALAEMDF
jgi:hypothetical protein